VVAPHEIRGRTGSLGPASRPREVSRPSVNWPSSVTVGSPLVHASGRASRNLVNSLSGKHGQADFDSGRLPFLGFSQSAEEPDIGIVPSETVLLERSQDQASKRMISSFRARKSSRYFGNRRRGK